MYIDFVPNRRSKPAILLRESIREGKRIRKRTIANLSALTLEQAEAIRLVLKGEQLAPGGGGLDCIRSLPHGHVEAVRIAMRRLGFDKLIDGKASRERDLVAAMVAGRIIAPEASKLAMTHAFSDTTLAEEFSVADAHEDELYAAMDWLIERQDKIEKRLAKRHLKEGGLVLFDLTSSSFEGVTCPLAKIGYSRDGKPGTLQVNYGLLTDARGCPVAVSVFEGNTADPRTLLPQVEKVRNSFGIASLVIVGDRGMISNVQIEAMRAMEGVNWIAALKSGAIATLANTGKLQLDLFDERNLISFTSEDYPGERLVACRNPELAKLRAAKRRDLIAATERELQKITGMVAGGKLAWRDKIGVRVGKVLNKYKVGKHFDLDIQDAAFSFSVNEERVAAEAALDGLYVIRASAAEADMSAEAAVLNYKRLAEVERAFRTLKGVDLQVRPIRHRLEERVKAHIFLSMLAYYVQWHLAEAWKLLLFETDEAPADEARERDPVAPASRSRRRARKGAEPPPRRWLARPELSRSADASGHNRAQCHAPQRRKTRHRDLHPHDRGQPKTAASPRSGRRHRGVDTAATPVSIASD